MIELEPNDRLNPQTYNFVWWLLASETPGSTGLVQEAWTAVEGDLACLEGKETCLALRDCVAKRVKEIVRSLLRELDKSGDDLNEPPWTPEALRRYMLGDAFMTVDCEAAAEELLRLAGKWAPGKTENEKA